MVKRTRKSIKHARHLIDVRMTECGHIQAPIRPLKLSITTIKHNNLSPIKNYPTRERLGEKKREKNRRKGGKGRERNSGNPRGVNELKLHHLSSKDSKDTTKIIKVSFRKP